MRTFETSIPATAVLKTCQAIILPNHYPYCYKVNESTLLINSKSDTIFTFVYNLKNILV